MKSQTCRKTAFRQPPFATTTLDSHAISFTFVCTDRLMRAFVTEYPQLHWHGEANEEVGIKHNKSAPRGAEIAEVEVEYRGR